MRGEIVAPGYGPRIRGFNAIRMARTDPPPPSADLAAEPVAPASYEDALEELERLAGRIESGDMPLDDLLGAYQRGVALLAFCRGRLERVEEQIKVLEAGTLKPWSGE